MHRKSRRQTEEPRWAAPIQPKEEPTGRSHRDPEHDGGQQEKPTSATKQTCAIKVYVGQESGASHVHAEVALSACCRLAYSSAHSSRR